tara:strand:+ start:360 stop:803 length:444 start_codon:yes stop_codon:yes gene_type:complete
MVTTNSTFSPWNGPMGSARQHSPAFQREYGTLQGSSIPIAGLNSAGNTEILVLSPSATLNTSGSVFLWGVSLVTGDSSFAAGFITDQTGNKYCGCIATNQGPYMIAFDTPIKVTQNSQLLFEAAANIPANSFCTPFYLVLPEIPEGD